MGAFKYIIFKICAGFSDNKLDIFSKEQTIIMANKFFDNYGAGKLIVKPIEFKGIKKVKF